MRDGTKKCASTVIMCGGRPENEEDMGEGGSMCSEDIIEDELVFHER